MDAVVTGCAGFIGGHLTRRLLEDGWNVVGIDALRPYYDPSEKLDGLTELRNHPRFTFVCGDLVATELPPYFSSETVVFHLAAQPGVRGSFGETFAQYTHDNILATQKVFEAAIASHVPRVVFASSSSVYGDAVDYPCVEGASLPQPRSPYGVTKATCEQLASVYRQLGLETVGLRYFTVYGPGQRPDMAMRRLCEAALGGPLFQLFGDGRQSRDFTYVADVVDATIRAGTAASPAPIINIGGGQEATMLDVIDTISSFEGAELSIEPGKFQQGDVRRTGADTSVAQNTLGWTPRVGLIDGLRAEFDWVKDRRSGALLDLVSLPAMAVTPESQ